MNCFIRIYSSVTFNFRKKLLWICALYFKSLSDYFVSLIFHSCFISFFLFKLSPIIVSNMLHQKCKLVLNVSKKMVGLRFCNSNCHKYRNSCVQVQRWCVLLIQILILIIAFQVSEVFLIFSQPNHKIPSSIR